MSGGSREHSQSSRSGLCSVDSLLSSSGSMKGCFVVGGDGLVIVFP